MATRVKPRPDLHGEDLYAWSKAQADLPRAGRFAELDLAHLIEEIEDAAAGALPATCPYGFDQITGDWLPR